MTSRFDPAKSAKNVLLPGRADLPFEVADEFDMATAIFREDARPHPKTGEPYPERRIQAVGKIGRKMVMVVFTPLEGGGRRVISLRSASRKERKAWQDAQGS